MPARTVSSEHASVGRPCSIAAALRIVGEKWSLLAVREISFGNHRFEALATNTGGPRDILTTRLRSLEAAGVIRREQYNDTPPRYEYHLTDSGHDLFGVLQSLRMWGDKWAVDAAPMRFAHTCGHELDVVPVCRHCDEVADLAHTTAKSRLPDWDLAGRRLGTSRTANQ